MSLEAQVAAYFKKYKKTLSIAESCTGGEIAASLTKLPGASDYFLGSIVVYSNAWKETFLGISKKLLEEKGAVSQEVALEMAESLQKLSNSDVALAVTGIAGPDGGSQEKPVGTVCFALVTKTSKNVWKKHFKGSREEIILASKNELLSQTLAVQL